MTEAPLLIYRYNAEWHVEDEDGEVAVFQSQEAAEEHAEKPYKIFSNEAQARKWTEQKHEAGQ